MLQNRERREREMSIVAQFFMIMGGVLTGYVGIGLAAAIGKLVGGGIFRFQFDEFIFFMVRLSKSGKHFSFGLCDPRPYIKCQMIDMKPTKVRGVIYDAFSMAVALFVTETVSLQLFAAKRMPFNAFTLPMAIVMIGYTCFIIVHLVFTQKKNVGDNPGGALREEYQRVYGEIKKGTEPGKIEIKDLEYTGHLTDLGVYKKYLMLKYYHFLDKGDYAQVSKVIDDLENYVPDKWSKSDLPMLAELVFYHVIIRKNEAKAQFYGKSFCSMLEGNEAVNEKRVFAYWLFFVQKDRGAALQYTMKTLKQISSYHLTGCQNLEKKLLSALIKRIERTA